MKNNNETLRLEKKMLKGILQTIARWKFIIYYMPSTELLLCLWDALSLPIKLKGSVMALVNSAFFRALLFSLNFISFVYI